MQTFWLSLLFSNNDKTEGDNASRDSDSVGPIDELAETEADDKLGRLIDWNFEQLSRLLKLIVARREVASNRVDTTDSKKLEVSLKANHQPDCVLEEVREIIQLPEFDHEAARHEETDLSKIELTTDDSNQLRTYIMCLAQLYHENPFHSFEHASHVTMSVLKVSA